MDTQGGTTPREVTPGEVLHPERYTRKEVYRAIRYLLYLPVHSSLS